MTRAIALLFFVSGFVALLYEILWIRELSYVFGASSPAVSSVVAGFLTGLAFGAWFAGRCHLGRHGGLRTYALLELGIAATAPLAPTLLRMLDRTVLDGHWDALAEVGLAGAVRFAAVFLGLLAPTALMGATLPVLCNTLSQSGQRVGVVVARLYGLNTLGGVLGCLVAGFWVIETWGLRASLVAAALVNVSLALVALAMHRRAGRGAATSEATEFPDVVPSDVARGWILVAVAVTSGVSIATEMVWTRLLALAVGGTTYAFSLVLAVFLVGLGLGALSLGAVLRRRALGSGALGLAQVAVGAYILIGMAWCDERLQAAALTIHDVAGDFSARSFTSLEATLWLALVPSFFFGVSFPLLSELWVRRRAELGSGVGLLYLCSTAGGVAGSVLATYVWLPAYGLEATLAGLGLVAVVFGVVFAVGTGRLRVGRMVLGAPTLLVAVVWWMHGEPLAAWRGLDDWRGRTAKALSHEAWSPKAVYGGLFLYGDKALDPKRSLRSVRDGAACSVAVFEEQGQVSLAVNGKVDASAGQDMSTQLMLAWLPQVMHPQPERVFVLGWGAGVTAGAAAQYGSDVLCAEIEQGVVDAAPHFADVNYGAHDRSDVKVVVDDGRSVLRRSRVAFDVITTEPSNPWMAGMSSLFTREFYALCRERLGTSGILCQWVQLYWSSAEDYRAILATMHDVFPHLAVFRSTFGDSLILASATPIEEDYGALERRLAARPEVVKDLVRHVPHVLDAKEWPLSFLSGSMLVWGDDAVRDLGDDVPRITDDRPFLEFRAARRMKAASGPAILAALLPEGAPRVHGEASLWPRLSARQRAATVRLAGHDRLRAGMLNAADDWFARAESLDPTLPDLAYHRWQVAMRRGDESARTTRLDAMVQRSPGRLMQAADDASRHGDVQFALDLLSRAQRLQGPGGRLALARADVLERAERWDDATEALEVAKRQGAPMSEIRRRADRIAGLRDDGE